MRRTAKKDCSACIAFVSGLLVTALLAGCTAADSGEPDEQTAEATSVQPEATTSPSTTPADQPDDEPEPISAEERQAAEAELAAAMAFVGDDYPNLDASGLSELFDLRSLGVVERTDEWVGFVDDFDGNPVLLTSVDGFGWNVKTATGLPERMQGPYSLWTLGDDVVAVVHVSEEQNSALLHPVVLRSSDGRTWEKVEMENLVGDDAGVAITGDGLTLGFVGEVTNEREITQSTVYLIEAQTDEVTTFDAGQLLVTLTADEDQVFALLNPAVSGPPTLASIEPGGAFEYVSTSQGFSPLVTENVGPTQLAFNDDRFFASTDLAATWTEFVYPGSSRASATFSRFGAFSDRIGAGDERAFGISSDGIVWHEIEVPPNTVDVSVSGLGPSGALIFIRLEGLSSSLLALVPWPDAMVDLGDADVEALRETPNKRAIGRLAETLLAGLPNEPELIACVTESARLDVAPEVMRAAIECDNMLIDSLSAEIFTALTDGSLDDEAGVECALGALTDFTAEWVIQSSRSARDAIELRVNAGELPLIRCGRTTGVRAPSDLAGVLEALGEMNGTEGSVPSMFPVRAGELNYWQLPAEELSLLLVTEPTTNRIVEASVRIIEPPAGWAIGGNEAAVLAVIIESLGIDAPPPVLSFGPIGPGTEGVDFCTSDADGASTLRIVLGPEGC